MQCEISSEPNDDDDDPVYKFEEPEDLLIEVVGDKDTKTWDDASIETYSILTHHDEFSGSVSYTSHHGCIEYMVKDLIDFPGIGWFVIEAITAVYTPGEWGYIDDDMIFYYKSVRPATQDEIKLA